MSQLQKYAQQARRYGAVQRRQAAQRPVTTRTQPETKGDQELKELDEKKTESKRLFTISRLLTKFAKQQDDDGVINVGETRVHKSDDTNPQDGTYSESRERIQRGNLSRAFQINSDRDRVTETGPESFTNWADDHEL